VAARCRLVTGGGATTDKSEPSRPEGLARGRAIPLAAESPQVDDILIRPHTGGSMQRHRPRYVPWLGLLIIAGFVFIIATFFYTGIAHGFSTPA
jgi:hypothetical protein